MMKCDQEVSDYLKTYVEGTRYLNYKTWRGS